jgi:hypothetical protein
MTGSTHTPADLEVVRAGRGRVPVEGYGEAVSGLPRELRPMRWEVVALYDVVARSPRGEAFLAERFPDDRPTRGPRGNWVILFGASVDDLLRRAWAAGLVVKDRATAGR